MVRDHSGSIVSGRAGRGNASGIDEGVDGADEALTTLHGLSIRRFAILSFCVQFNGHRPGIELVEKNVDAKEIPFPLLLYCGGTESQC